ncbi:MAG: VWA domain-containing protein [Polyangiales bacterium]
MSWDEALFGWIYRRASALARPAPSPEALARAAHLGDLDARLAVVASALAGERVTVRAAESAGGAADRALLLLPASLDVAPTREGNERAYLHRVVCGVAAGALGLFAPRELPPAASAVYTALAMPAVWREADARLPGFEALRREVAAWELARRPSPVAPRAARVESLVRATLSGELGVALADADDLARAAEAFLRGLDALPSKRGDGDIAPVASWGAVLARAAASAAVKAPVPAEALPRGTERAGKARDVVREVKLARDRIDENPLTHSFEKVHTAEEYKGGRKAADGDDDMASQGDALDELDLREVIRSPEAARSLYRADVTIDGAAGDLADGDDEPGDRVIPYDEWDHKARRRRPGWCSVREFVAPTTVTPAEAAARVRATLHRHRAVLRTLRAEFERVEHGRAWRGRQPDGPDVDLDALVDRHACLLAGHAPPDRLYAARRRHRPDVATLVLLDASLSSDAWAAGRRVLDVARDAVVVLGEALSGLHDELAVAAFSSHTRRDCRYAVLKGAREPWPRAWARLASVEPNGYTRIGPALRHATAALARMRARRKLLLVVTDGRPTDYDRYEGRYGVADVAMAAREAGDASVELFALAVDARAGGHLQEMFGRGRFAVLPRPDALAEAMAGVYGRALTG